MSVLLLFLFYCKWLLKCFALMETCSSSSFLNCDWTIFSHAGYGHTAPLSDGGKAFCIIYSAFGIPFTLLFLTAAVQRIMVFSTRRPIVYIQRHWGLSKPLVAICHACLLAILALSCFLLIPAAIFSALEGNWNFLESFYFCFISLSTIGLGDYVPGEALNQKYRELYKLGITGEQWQFSVFEFMLKGRRVVAVKSQIKVGTGQIVNPTEAL